jgi:D-alanyl-D-alanine carboxypeptidase/D-alanyl-D-alanine-endopeptidase (penicillin-binding protein 4)
MARDQHGRVLTWLPVVVVLLLLAGAAGYYLDAWDRFQDWRRPDPQTEPAAVPPPQGLVLPEHAPPAPVAATVPASRSGDVAPRKVGRVLAAGLRERTLGRHVVARVGDLSGTGPDWTNGEEMFVPASTTKILTAAAALAAMGPDHRFTTRVVAGARKHRIVLVGGGDPYLASKPLTPADARTAYPERADVVTLARRTARALVEQQGRNAKVRLSYDDSLFTGPTDNPHWRRDYVPDDIVSPITALWVDRGNDPGGYGKADDPSRVAAEAFARALARQGVTVVGAPRPGTALPEASEVAEVESAPLADIVERLLDVSDNEAAEVVAHHVGLAVDNDGSFAGGARAVLSTLRDLGVPTQGAVVHDGSGLSRRNRVSAETMLATLRLVALPDRPDLRAVLTGLPVAGFTGSLTYRFDDGKPAGRGAVRAKTGTLTGIHGLAGLVTDRQGNTMVFVLAADRVRVPDTLDAREALDRLAAELAACRCGVR